MSLSLLFVLLHSRKPHSLRVPPQKQLLPTGSSMHRHRQIVDCMDVETTALVFLMALVQAHLQRLPHWNYKCQHTSYGSDARPEAAVAMQKVHQVDTAPACVEHTAMMTNCGQAAQLHEVQGSPAVRFYGCAQGQLQAWPVLFDSLQSDSPVLLPWH